LEGHIKEQNYGADWGDFASFSKHMKHKAGSLGVDLLIIDTGKIEHFGITPQANVFFQVTYMTETETVMPQAPTACFPTPFINKLITIS
jgi:hypothetical protein